MRRSGTQLIAIVSEQDSAYGRLLYDIVKDLSGEEAYDVRRYGYLLGVDGETPPASRESNTASVTSRDADVSDHAITTSLMATAHREQSFGVSQLDYVRRLADHIAFDSFNANEKETNTNKGVLSQNPNRPVVIGVLGADVYDKLLVLQALRERLPTATFFSTDLDARMADPDVYGWTRNLIVGSSYGLTVEGQRGAGFRDSYQTALYRGVRLALDKKYKETTPPPRVFEIGRTGPVDITTHPTECAKKVYKDVHGSILYVRSKRTHWRWMGSTVFVLVPLLLLTIYAFVKFFALHHEGLVLRRRAHFRVGILGAASFVTLGIGSLYWRGQEPWPFFEGVNSVPTLLLRGTVVFFAYAVIDIAIARIRQTHKDIQGEFCLSVPDTCKSGDWLSLAKSRPKVPWIWRWMADLSGVSNEKKKAKKCWRKYVKHSDWLARLARMAIPTFLVAVVLVITHICSLNLFPRPDLLLTRNLDWEVGVARGLAVFATLVTVFFCRDALKLGQATLREFVRHRVRWPDVCKSDVISQHRQTMNFLVHYTECVAPFTVLPFILLFLLIVARSTVFEGWIWTNGALALYAVLALYILIQALRFQFEAARSKEAILASIDHHRSKFVADPHESARANIVREEITGIRRGAFVPWTRNPILQSVLLPSGAYGVLILLDTLF